MKYSISAVRCNLDGDSESYAVGYDNKAAYDFENLMLFNTQEEALNWTESNEAREWVGCHFEVCELDEI